MAENRTNQFIDAGNAESEIYEPNAEVKQEFAEAQLISHATEPFDRDDIFSSRVSAAGGTVVANPDGEEAVGGLKTTPEDDQVGAGQRT